MRPDQELILKAASVATRAPMEWAGFVQALKEFADVKARECVSSPPEQLQITQGRAQQCASLVALFGDAVKSADRIVQHAGGNKRSTL